MSPGHSKPVGSQWHFLSSHSLLGPDSRSETERRRRSSSGRRRSASERWRLRQMPSDESPADSWGETRGGMGGEAGKKGSVGSDGANNERSAPCQNNADEDRPSEPRPCDRSASGGSLQSAPRNCNGDADYYGQLAGSEEVVRLNDAPADGKKGHQSEGDNGRCELRGSDSCASRVSSLGSALIEDFRLKNSIREHRRGASAPVPTKDGANDERSAPCRHRADEDRPSESRPCDRSASGGPSESAPRNCDGDADDYGRLAGSEEPARPNDAPADETNGRQSDGRELRGSDSCASRVSSLGSALIEDFRLTNSIRERRRGASMPIPTKDGDDRRRHRRSHDGSGPASMIAEFVALKVKVAELQSELQLAQGLAQKYSSGLQQATSGLQQAHGAIQDLKRRNAKLEKENRELLWAMGNLRRAGRLEGMEEEMGLCANREVRVLRSVDGGSKRHAPRRNGRKRAASESGEGAEFDRGVGDGGKIEEKGTTAVSAKEGSADASGKQNAGPSWWTKRRPSHPPSVDVENRGIRAVMTALSDEKKGSIIVQDMPLPDPPPDRALAKRSSMRSFFDLVKSTASQSNLSMKRRMSASQIGSHPDEGDEVVVPESVQFQLGAASDLRCSEITLDPALVRMAIVRSEAEGRTDGDDGVEPRSDLVERLLGSGKYAPDGEGAGTI